MISVLSCIFPKPAVQVSLSNDCVNFNQKMTHPPRKKCDVKQNGPTFLFWGRGGDCTVETSKNVDIFKNRIV